MTTNGNGTFENKKIWVNYSNNNASIKVYSKAVDNFGNPTDKYFEDGGKRLSKGSYQWKVVAHDKAGHTQETETRKLRVNARQFYASQNWFPLTIESITGIGDGLDLSTIHPEDIKEEYLTSYFEPTIKGIAFASSTVSLELTDETCESEGKGDCTKTYSTTADINSRYSIKFPKNSLRSGIPYRITISVKDDKDNYNELPSFLLKVGGEGQIKAEEEPEEEKVLGEKESSFSDQLADSEDKETNLVNVKVKVVNEKNKKPLGGVKVTLHSTPQEAITDKGGIAEFNNVEKGEHLIKIAYKGQTGEQKVNLEGEVKDFLFTIQVKESSPFANRYVILVISFLLVVIALMGFVLLKKNKVLI